jgi:hypothetical protein
MGHSYRFAETLSSAMEAALRRNRNVNLHKLPAKYVLKLSETALHSG